MPVLPKGELEVLLEAAIDLSKKGRNTLDIISLVCSVNKIIKLIIKGNLISFTMFGCVN